MILPYSYPRRSADWMRWRLALVTRPVMALADRNQRRLGMATPPQLFGHWADGTSVEVTGEGYVLRLVGQMHTVMRQQQDGGLSPDTGTWFPDKASAYWLAEAHALRWLGDCYGTDRWPAAVGLYESWERQARGLGVGSSAQVVYQPDVVGQRLVAVVRLLGRMQQQADLGLYQSLRGRAVRDVAFLRRIGNGGLEGWARLSLLEGQAAFAASFDRAEPHLAPLLDQTAACVADQWDAKGDHESADGAVALACLYALGNLLGCFSRMKSPTAVQAKQIADCRETLVRASHSLSVLVQHFGAHGGEGGKRFARFSGFPLPSAEPFYQFLEAWGGYLKPGVGGSSNLWCRVRSGRRQASGEPGEICLHGFNGLPTQMLKRGSRAYHAGLGGIEISSELGPLVGGCGIGQDLTRWGVPLRATQAFSTLCLPNEDALPVLPHVAVPTKDSPPLHTSMDISKVGDAQVLELAHDGYSNSMREVQVYRRLRLSNAGQRLDGEERVEVQPRHGGEEAERAVAVVKNALVRFQFAPNVEVERTSPTTLILTQHGQTPASGPVQWELVLTNGEGELDQGVWFDDATGKPRPAPNLALTAQVRDGRCLIFWRLERLRPVDDPKATIGLFAPTSIPPK